ncbi:MAG: hypothetical protein ACR2LM_01470 [Pyrinomonadaceae bacterium]
MIAARVAADLKQLPNLTVETISGGLGELSVDLDGTRVFKSRRLWYPTPANVIQKIREAMDEA